MHNSMLFATWHRPYLALFEQALYACVQEEYLKFPASARSEYTEAARDFRIAYWDFAWKNAQGTLPDMLNAPVVRIRTPEGLQELPNPFYKYVFHPKEDLQGEFQFGSWSETKRHPGESQNGQEPESRPDEVEKQVDGMMVDGIPENLRTRIYKLFTDYEKFEDFATTVLIPAPGDMKPGRTYDSLEGIHDVVHGRTGGIGNMGYLAYSAYDPIFWLHHANIDRLLAIWQVFHPDSWVVSAKQKKQSWTLSPGDTVDANTRKHLHAHRTVYFC
jgi:tyrosinase